MRHKAPTAFWRAWSIWAVSVAATATTLSYTVLHPLPATLTSQLGSGLDGSIGVVFVVGFATVGALLAWKRPGTPSDDSQLAGPGLGLAPYRLDWVPAVLAASARAG